MSFYNNIEYYDVNVRLRLSKSKTIKYRYSPMANGIYKRVGYSFASLYFFSSYERFTGVILNLNFLSDLTLTLEYLDNILT